MQTMHITIIYYVFFWGGGLSRQNLFLATLTAKPHWFKTLLKISVLNIKYVGSDIVTLHHEAFSFSEDRKWLNARNIWQRLWIRQTFICIVFFCYSFIIFCTFFLALWVLKCFPRLYTLKKKVNTAASGKITFVICHFVSIFSHLIKLVNKLRPLYMKNPHRISNNSLLAVPRRSFFPNFQIGSLCCHPLTEHSLPWAASLLPYCLSQPLNLELLQTLLSLKKHSWLAARPSLPIDTVRSLWLS